MPPRGEALLLLESLVVPERAATTPDREAGRLRALHVHVRRDSVPGLVDRDGTRFLGDVLDVDRGAGLDRRHRVDDVAPPEALPPVVVRDGQRHRADLLDHRRRVAVRDPGELVAAPRRVEVLLVRDLVDVEVEDVEPVLARRRSEPDVTPHAPRPDERGIEHLEGHVAGADEEDLLLARLRARETKRFRSDLARHDVRGIRPGVDAIRPEAPPEGRVADPVHHDEQLVQRQTALVPHHPAREHEVGRPLDEPGVGAARGSARSANNRSRQARVSSTRSPVGVSAPFGP